LAIRSYTRAFTKMDGVRDLGGALSVCVGPEKACQVLHFPLVK
jgi:hypothetical protein